RPSCRQRKPLRSSEPAGVYGSHVNRPKSRFTSPSEMRISGGVSFARRFFLRLIPADPMSTSCLAPRQHDGSFPNHCGKPATVLYPLNTFQHELGVTTHNSRCHEQPRAGTTGTVADADVASSQPVALIGREAEMAIGRETISAGRGIVVA